MRKTRAQMRFYMRQQALLGFKVGKRQMLTFVVLLNLIAGGAILHNLAQTYKRYVSEAETRSQNLALAVQNSVVQEFAKIDVAISTVVNILKTTRGGREPSNDLFVNEAIESQKELVGESEAWSITDKFGNVIHHVGGDRPTNFSIADREYFKAHALSHLQGLHYSAPIASRVTGSQIIVLSKPYFDSNGNFSGIVAVPIPLSHMYGMLQGFNLGSDGMLSIIDREHGVLVRLSEKRESPRKSGIPFVANSVPSIEISRRFIDDIEDTSRFTSHKAIPKTNLVATVGISKKHFLSEWYKQLAIESGLLLTFLGFLNFSASYLYRTWLRQRRISTALNRRNIRLKELLRALSDRDRSLVSAQEAGGLGTYVMDVKRDVWESSEQLNVIFGIDSQFSRTTQGWMDIIYEPDRSMMEKYFFEEVIGKRGIFDREYRIIRPCDGRTIWVHGLGKLDFDPKGMPAYMRGTIQDVSKRKNTEERLVLGQQVFQSALEGIMVTDRAGEIVEVNPAFTQITGYQSEEVLGRTPHVLKSGVQDTAFYSQFWESLMTRGMWEGELVNRRRDGKLYNQRSRISAVRDETGEITHFTALISDITEFKAGLKQIEHLAYHDKLTDLANRTLISDRILQAIAQCQRRQTYLCVCYLDLDGFKPINDAWGHDVGDQLLVEVANRLRKSVRAVDSTARLGGDEFLILLCDLKQERDVESALKRVLSALTEPYNINGIVAELTLSVGVTIYPNDTAEDPDALIRNADQAMYEAKRSGKNRIHFFDSASDRRVQEHQEQYARLKQALLDGEFRLHYQPKVHLKTGAVVGVEALIRWQHPELGLLPPGKFLPVIESTDQAIAVGNWVLREALSQIRKWKALGISLPVSVNVFSEHLQSETFSHVIERTLGEFPDIDPALLDLEILETTAMENLIEISKHMGKCKKLGVSFSLDDFGTGYSSLTYFRSLPVDLVKIDRSFVQEILRNDEDVVLVKGIVGMAHALNRKVIAEGVETLEHGVLLLNCGCDQVQGFGISRPIPPEMIPEWLEQWSMPESWVTATAA